MFAKQLFLLAALCAVGCQGQSFSGQAPTVAGAQKQSNGKFKNPSQPDLAAIPDSELANNDPHLTENDAEKILAEDGSISDDDIKILSCISQWGELGFSKEALKGYKKLGVSSEGFASGTIKDTKASEKPRLVLVQASSTGFAGAHIELMNPKGWYCIDVANVGFSSSRILMHCDAEEAGFNQKNTGFSSTQVTRVGC